MSKQESDRERRQRTTTEALSMQLHLFCSACSLATWFEPFRSLSRVSSLISGKRGEIAFEHSDICAKTIAMNMSPSQNEEED
jgi:hypothetical protein